MGLNKREIGVIRSYLPYELSFTDKRVPVENRLGDEGQGFAIAQKWLVHARVPYAAAVIGIAQEALRLAIDWSHQRNVHKSVLGDKQAIQWMIADSEMELRAAGLLTWQAAWTGDLGRDIKTEASIAKVVATETAGRVIASTDLRQPVAPWSAGHLEPRGDRRPAIREGASWQRQAQSR